MSNSAFPDVEPFPGRADQAAPIGHNRPPFEETVVAEFLEGLAKEHPGLIDKINIMVERGTAAEPCLNNPDLAGRYGDFIKMAAAHARAVEAERERHNRPLLTAQRTLKARADSIIDPLTRAVANVRRHLDAYMADERRKAAEAQRLADEQAHAAREAAEAERQRQIDERVATGKTEFPEVDESPLPAIDIEPARVEQPVVRGYYGSRVGTTTVWHHEILSVRQLPDRILKHAKVIEALDKVIAAEIRGASGKIEIKGVRIWSQQTARVR